MCAFAVVADVDGRFLYPWGCWVWLLDLGRSFHCSLDSWHFLRLHSWLMAVATALDMTQYDKFWLKKKKKKISLVIYFQNLTFESLFFMP